MKSYWLFCVLLSTVGLWAQSSRTNTAVNTSLCEIAANPGKYAGTMISIRGSVLKGWLHSGKTLKTFVLTEPDSSVVCPSVRIEVVMPDDVKPKPDFNVEKDAAFTSLENALHERTAIEGVFEGRFDYKAGGKDRLRLVVHRVSNLDIQKTGHIDR